MTIEQNAKTKPLDSNKSTAKTESVELAEKRFRKRFLANNLTSEILILISDFFIGEQRKKFANWISAIDSNNRISVLQRKKLITITKSDTLRTQTTRKRRTRHKDPSPVNSIRCPLIKRMNHVHVIDQFKTRLSSFICHI